MHTLLEQKIVVITGSSRGFGYAIARACLAAGAIVAITGRSQQAVDHALNGLQSPGRAAGFLLDVRDEGQVQAFAQKVIEKFGRFDIWINNAAYSSAAGMVLDVNPHEALEMFLSNDLGALHGAQVAMKHFLPRKAGMLVNIYGHGSFLRPSSPTAMYGMTKAWLTSMTRSLAHENKGSGVKILGFSPGMMMTDMLTSPRVVGDKAKEQMKNFPFVLRFLAGSPEAAAQKLVRIISRQRKEFLEYQLFKPWTPLLGLLRVVWENLTKTGKTPEVILKYEPAYEFKREE